MLIITQENELKVKNFHLSALCCGLHPANYKICDVRKLQRTKSKPVKTEQPFRSQITRQNVSYAQTIRGTQQHTFAPVRRDNNTWARNDKQKAESFALYLSKVFTPNTETTNYVKDDDIKQTHHYKCVNLSSTLAQEK